MAKSYHSSTAPAMLPVRTRLKLLRGASGAVRTAIGSSVDPMAGPFRIG